MLEKFEGEKRKQYIVLGIALAIGAGVILFLSAQTSKKPRKKAPEPEVKVVEEKKVEEESFKSVYGRKLFEQQQEIERLKRELEKLKREKERMSSVSPPPPPPLPPLPSPPPQRTQSQPQQTRKQQPSPPSPPLQPPQSSTQKKGPPQTQVLTNLIVLDVEERKEKTSTAEVKKERGKKGERLKAGDVIPAGSFVRGVLLNGLNAPAGGKALSNPLPVLIRVVDLSVLPNRFRADIRDCFIVGAGYGDLSSERAYIRAETLSCVKENGEVLEAKVEGYVSGEDGMVGLSGRVVTKQGQMLARTLVAGFLEGVANAFQQSSTVVSITPQGAVSTIKPEDALKVGMFSGAAEATKKLADFYMKLANQMFPVIEINAGRKVDVVFLKSVRLGGKD